VLGSEFFESAVAIFQLFEDVLTLYQLGQAPLCS